MQVLKLLQRKLSQLFLLKLAAMASGIHQVFNQPTFFLVVAVRPVERRAVRVVNSSHSIPLVTSKRKSLA